MQEVRVSARASLRRHTLWYFTGRASAGIINFLSISLFAHLLLPAGYGLYTLIMSSVAIANSLFFQWLRIALIRYVPGSCEKRNSILSTIISIYILENLLIFSMSTLIYLFTLKVEIFLFSIILALQGWFENTLELARAELKPTIYNAMLFGKSILSFCIGLLLIKYGLGAIGALLGQVAGLLIMSAIAYTYQWRGLYLFVDRSLVYQFITYGLAISLSLLMSSLVAYLDRFLIAVFAGRFSAGTYAAIYDIASSIMLLVMQVPILSGFPMAVEAYHQSRYELCRQILRETYLVSFRLCIPIAIVLTMLSSFLTDFLLGEQYRYAHSILWWLCPGLVIYGLTEYYYNRSLWLNGNPWYLSGVMGFACVVNTILNIILIPLYGMHGAAFATLAAYLCSAAISRILARRTFPLLPLTPDIWGPILSACAMGGVFIITGSWHGLLPSILRIALGIGVYYATLHLLGKWLRERESSEEE